MVYKVGVNDLNLSCMVSPGLGERVEN